jgi:HSP20 family molecular chaperone IbpA
MRYRRVSYRRTTVIQTAQVWPFGEIWQLDRLRLLMPGHWRPDSDAYETATTIEIMVDLAGVDEDDFEVQLFEDALVVEGRRQLRASPESAVYHAAGIRQGPFRVELPLPALVDAERVEAAYDRGLLHISLPKRTEAR